MKSFGKIQKYNNNETVTLLEENAGKKKKYTDKRRSGIAPGQFIAATFKTYSGG